MASQQVCNGRLESGSDIKIQSDIITQARELIFSMPVHVLASGHSIHQTRRRQGMQKSANTALWALFVIFGMSLSQVTKTKVRPVVAITKQDLDLT